jgi:hypothetical protein
MSSLVTRRISLNDGGYGTSAAPIYHLFVEQAKALEPRYLSMVIPARWFAGGKGLDEFREAMLADNRLRSIADYLSAADVFPGVGLKGGVCYFLWNRDHPGLCDVSTHFKDWPVSTATRPLMENGADIFIRFNEGLSILKKVMALESDVADGFVPSAPKKFDQLVSSLRPFGFRTYFRGRKTDAQRRCDDLQNGGTAYVARDLEVETGTDLIDKWKIYVGRAAPGTGNRDTYPHRILSTPFIGEAGSICSETYLCIGPFDSKSEAESALSYLTLSADAPADSPAQAVTRHHAQGLHLRAETRMDKAMDGRRPVCQIWHYRERDRFHRKGGSTDGSDQ